MKRVILALALALLGGCNTPIGPIVKPLTCFGARVAEALACGDASESSGGESGHDDD